VETAQVIFLRGLKTCRMATSVFQVVLFVSVNGSCQSGILTTLMCANIKTQVMLSSVTREKMTFLFPLGTEDAQMEHMTKSGLWFYVQRELCNLFLSEEYE